MRAGAPDQRSVVAAITSRRRSARASPRRRRSRAQHLVVGALVVAAEIAVAEMGADFLRVHQAHARRSRSSASAGSAARQPGNARPREVLHPGGVARRRDRSPSPWPRSSARSTSCGTCTCAVRMRRPSIPDGEDCSRRVAAMAVDEQRCGGSRWSLEAVEDVADDRGCSVSTRSADRAGKGHEIGRDAVAERREHRHAQRLGGLGARRARPGCSRPSG